MGSSLLSSIERSLSARSLSERIDHFTGWLRKKHGNVSSEIDGSRGVFPQVRKLQTEPGLLALCFFLTFLL